MLVRIGQQLARPVEMHSKRGGEPALMLQFGSVVDFRLARTIEILLADLTTYDAAKAQWNKAPLTYDETAMLVGCPRRFLVRKVNAGEIPCLDFGPASAPGGGSHRAFVGHHVEEIQQRFEHGELRYARKGGRPWHA